ncbi:hypothetical protein SHANETTE_49 [Bacillus phage Shanette]|uniref:Uncharacterized protein n=1 Tax=Bacillus phage Shanette TaxID=1296656 RepID=S5MAZ9_9CAUD|nr:hypothetical protein AVV46_gp049 [Bacillus phage Shanette]AGR46949.1 hypothetical protein SHANETTE_49 [Bacillus phage Shanette]
MKPFLSEKFHVDSNNAFQMIGITLKFSSHMEAQYYYDTNPKPPVQVDSLEGFIKVQQHSKNIDESYRLFGEARRYRSALTTHDVGIRELPMELQEKLVNTWAEVEKYLRSKTERVDG